MLNDYEFFLTNCAVINIKDRDEFIDFINLMRKLGLTKIDYIEKIYDEHGFDKGFCFNGGVRYCQPSDVCFEYQIGKGFTFSNKEQYLKNNEIKICSLDDILSATMDGIKIDNKILEKPRKRKIYTYLRFNTEEKIKDYFGIPKLDAKIKKVEDYKPIPGFYDLRDFDIPEKDFKELWKLQLYLDDYQRNRDKHSFAFPNLWDLLKQTAGDYQAKLLSFPLKSNTKNNEDLDLEVEK